MQKVTIVTFSDIFCFAAISAISAKQINFPYHHSNRGAALDAALQANNQRKRTTSIRQALRRC